MNRKSNQQSNFEQVLEDEIQLTGQEWQDQYPDAIGRTLFDQPGSKDHSITVVMPSEQIAQVPLGALVRIQERSQQDSSGGRRYLGIIVQGPFAEPDGLRADAPVVVTIAVRGSLFMPRFHGRIQVSILGEELDKGIVIPTRFRPIPNSPVYLLSCEETADQLHVWGDVQLGYAVGYEDLPVCLSTQRKDVFPRHTAVLGTTGSGKSTTISGLIGNLSQQDVAVVVFDTEGEYTHIMEPTADARMQTILDKQSVAPTRLENVGVYHLIGRESSHPDYPDRHEFALEFSRLSPFAIIEILGLNEAQQERFLRAYDLARQVLATLKIYPSNRAEEAEWLELDDLETGCPRLTLPMMYDVVRACAELVAGEDSSPFLSPTLEQRRNEVMILIQSRATSLPKNPWSWRKIQGALGQLVRLRIFDVEDTPMPDYEVMTHPGRITIIDLSGTDSQPINNLVISQILLGLRKQQEENYQNANMEIPIRKVVIIIEEAHEFVSASRIKQMQVLFDQLVRIARRGRKRWLSLIFVSQSPEDLPDEMLGLVNNFILHKITNGHVISRLKRSVGGVDESLWERLPDLASGIAIVKAGNLARPMLVSIAPTPHRLLMVE